MTEAGPATGRATGAGAPALPRDGRPKLRRHVRLSYDRARQQHVLLEPETVVVLNPTGAAILELCDGQRTVADISTELQARYPNGGTAVDDEMTTFLARLVARRKMEILDGQ